MKNQTPTNRFRNSASLKLIIIVALSLLLLIPTIFIRKLIEERQSRRNETIMEVTGKWGNQQTVCGPLLVIPYDKYAMNENKCLINTRNYFHVLPDELKITGTIKPEIRYRGIYKVITYKSSLIIQGKFTKQSFQNWPDNPDKIIWEEAILAADITDLRGISNQIMINWNQQDIEAQAGIPYPSVLTNGIYIPIRIEGGNDNTFIIKLELNGSELLHFVPLGKETIVELKSDWPVPSFDGSFLPDTRNITDKGFDAKWKVFQMNRPYPQKWSNNSYDYELENSSFGVSLILPIDIYQKTTRSVKYALLFVVLTFLTIFFIEEIGKKRIHFFNYMLTGFALIIFYSLLLALSEHLSFTLAYIISSLSIIGMITWYTHSLMRKWAFTFVTFFILIGLYVFLFSILHMADYALLVGNIGLFIILGIVMFFSRKIDWFQNRNSEATE